MIRVELKLSDTQIGMLQGLAFALLYGGLGIPVGWLAERYSRVRIIALATAFWSAATALSGMATSFGTMLLTRVGVGTGEAGFTAPTSSLVADHFPARTPRQRDVADHARPAHRRHGGRAAGRRDRAALGLARRVLLLRHSGTAGGLRHLVRPHRAAAGPCRRGRRAARGAAAAARRCFSHIWNVRSLRWIVIGGSICSIGIQGVAQFMVLYFVRSFDMPIRSAAALFGLLSGAVAGGGAGAGRIRHRQGFGA